jgi:hypothetical protein
MLNVEGKKNSYQIIFMFEEKNYYTSVLVFPDCMSDELKVQCRNKGCILGYAGLIYFLLVSR